MTQTPLDSTNLPTGAAGYPSLSPPAHKPTAPPSFRQRRDRQCELGRRTARLKRRPIPRRSVDRDRTPARHVHHRHHRCGNLYPPCLPLDVSVHLGMLAKWEWAPRPKELATAALARVDPPSMTLSPPCRLGSDSRHTLSGSTPAVRRVAWSRTVRSVSPDVAAEPCEPPPMFSGVVDEPVSRGAALAAVAVAAATVPFRPRQTRSD